MSQEKGFLTGEKERIGTTPTAPKAQSGNTKKGKSEERKKSDDEEKRDNYNEAKARRRK